MSAIEAEEGSRTVPSGVEPADGRAPVEDAPIRQPYVPSLDGLRALAVSAVLAYHLGYLEGGYLGVDLFFVVSGYLITTLLMTEAGRTGRVSLRSFWTHRFRRLMPAALVVVIAVMVATRLWLPSWRWNAIRGDALATLLYVENWRQIVVGESYFNGASPFRHAWSLSLEEQFYVLWPLAVVAVIAVVGRRRRAGIGVVAAVGAVLSAAWMTYLAAGSPDYERLSRLYLGTDTRAMTVLTGVVLAVVVAWLRDERVATTQLSRWRPVAAAAALPALVVAMLMTWEASNLDIRMYRGGFVVFALLSASLVLGCVAGVGPLASALSVRPLRWVGRQSYALYLWSWPVQLFAVERFELGGRHLVAVVLGVSLLLSVVTTELIERPIRYGGLFRGRWWVGPVAGLVACGLVVGLAAGGVPAPDYTTVTDDEARAEALRTLAAAPDPKPLVMVAGDSVAWSIAWQLGDAVPDYRVNGRGIIGCGVMPHDSMWITESVDEPQPYEPGCRDQPLADEKGLAADPDVIIYSVGAWESYDHLYQGRRLRSGTDELGDVLRSRISERLTAFTRSGAKVLVMLTPCFGHMLPNMGLERHDESKREWFNAILREEAAAQGPAVELIDPTPLLCNPDGSVIEGREGLTGGLARPDGSHYDEVSRVWLWKNFLSPAVAKVLAEDGAGDAPAEEPPS